MTTSNKKSTKFRAPLLASAAILGAGGHIQEREAPSEAAKRELAEETGVDANPKLLFSFPFSAHGHGYNLHIHEVMIDGNIKPDTQEWQWSGWLSREEVDSLVKEKKLMPDTIIFYERYLKEYPDSARGFKLH